ncbi:MAG: hypothetical protein Q7U54_12175 [Bacteroidales bacterium]|nr:hypothetical protein [Bacteroidales bacterium]
MVKLLLCCLFFILINTNSEIFASTFDKNTADTCICKVQIVMLDSTKEAYLIYAIIEKDSSQIVIVSLKNRSRKGEKIKLDEKYTIQINPYYIDNVFPNHMMIFDISLAGNKINVPSKGWASNVYTSPNLLGLRIKPDCHGH